MSDDDEIHDIMPIEVEIEMALCRGDLSHAERKLVALLRSDDRIPREVRKLMADFFDSEGGGQFVLEIKRRRRGKPAPMFPPIHDFLAAEVTARTQTLAGQGVKKARRKALEEVATASRKPQTKRKKATQLKPETVARYARAGRKKLRDNNPESI